MDILVLNGSPKGKNSITLQTVLYLEKIYPEVKFNYLNVGQQIKAFEKDFSKAKEALNKAEIILFAYPVYTFIVPYQLQRFIELIKENNIDMSNKIATQITTSKHFYDVTAHTYIEENCFDMNMHVIRGLSQDMDDLYKADGTGDAKKFFEQFLYAVKNKHYLKAPLRLEGKISNYNQTITDKEKIKAYDVVIVTNVLNTDTNLINMIEDFRHALPASSRVVNVRDFPFSAGCLGCFKCAPTGKCVHKDHFDEFLREEIQKASAIVYAFTIENHYTHSSFKEYDDRQFCNGHRQVTQGMPCAYLISGNYSNEPNLQMIIQGRAEVGGTYLSGIVTDEYEDTPTQIENLANELIFALDNKMTRPRNFLGVGGNKIFRDLIYLMRGMMIQDYKFYKKNKAFDDYPQKHPFTIIGMKFVGFMMLHPKLFKIKDMNKYILYPYKRVLEKVEKEK